MPKSKALNAEIHKRAENNGFDFSRIKEEKVYILYSAMKHPIAFKSIHEVEAFLTGYEYAKDERRTTMTKDKERSLTAKIAKIIDKQTYGVYDKGIDKASVCGSQTAAQVIMKEVYYE